MDLFDRQTRAFLEWFRARPGATFHKNIQLVDLRRKGSGRGIVATQDIEPGTILFTIPRDSIICSSTSLLPSKAPQAFTSPPAEQRTGRDGWDTQQDAWTRLILMLIYEHLQGSASQWKPYLDLLPRKFDTPMFWSQAEVAELQASAMRDAIGREQADTMIRTCVLPAIRAIEGMFFPADGDAAADDGRGPMSDEELVDLAHRMGSAVMAYAFDLEGDKDEEGSEEDGWVEDTAELGMVPMADMLNADAEFNAHISHEDHALVATALRVIKAGEEILNYYGPLSNGELLRRYGYVTMGHARHDVVELPWVLVEKRLGEWVGSNEEVWENVLLLIKEHLASCNKHTCAYLFSEHPIDSLVFERTVPEPDSTGQILGEAIFTGLPDDLEKRLALLLKATWNVFLNQDPEGATAAALSSKKKRRGVGLSCVLKALKDREAQFATSLEEDDRILSNAGERNRNKESMAVTVRLGEKRVLREAQSWISRKLKEIRRSVEQEQVEPSAKRRKLTS